MPEAAKPPTEGRHLVEVLFQYVHPIVSDMVTKGNEHRRKKLPNFGFTRWVAAIMKLDSFKHIQRAMVKFSVPLRFRRLDIGEKPPTEGIVVSAPHGRYPVWRYFKEGKNGTGEMQEEEWQKAKTEGYYLEWAQGNLDDLGQEWQAESACRPRPGSQFSRKSVLGLKRCGDERCLSREFSAVQRGARRSALASGIKRIRRDWTTRAAWPHS